MRVARNLACLALFALLLVDARMRKKPRRAKTVHARNGTSANHASKAHRGRAKLNASSAVVLSHSLGREVKTLVTNSVCMQLDVATPGSFLKASFAVGIDITLDKTNHALSIKGMIGGGVTAGLIFVKAAFFAQGTIEVTATVPEAVAAKGLLESAKWAIREWVESKRRTGPLSKIINAFKTSMGAAHGVNKIMDHRKQIIKKIETPTAADAEDPLKIAAATEAAQNVLIDDGMLTHKQFIHLVRTKAGDILKAMGAATGEANKVQAYHDGIERAWRGVYRNDPAVAGTSFYSERPKCSSIADKAKHPSKLLMCSFFKYGMYLADSEHDGTKGNANTKKMLPIVYDELFKVAGTSVEGEGTLMTARQLNVFLTEVKTRYDRQNLRIIEATTAGDTAAVTRRTARMFRTLGKSIRVFEMEAAGLIYLFALPEADLRKSMEEIAGPGTPPAACEAECMCGVSEVEFEGTIGFTFGSSGVGFCTPDTNPIQFTAVAGFTWKQKKYSSALGGDECILVKESNDDVFTVTLSGSTYLALDIGWHYDSVTGAYLGWEVNLRFRVPFKSVDTTEPDVPADPAPDVGWVVKIINVLMGNGDEEEQATAKKLNVAKFIEDKMKVFFESIFGKIAGAECEICQNKYINMIATGFASETGIKSMITKILGEVKFKPGMKIEKTVGFDIGYEKMLSGKKEFDFALDYLSYAEVKTGDIPVGGVEISVAGYKGAGARYEYSNEFEAAAVTAGEKL